MNFSKTFAVTERVRVQFSGDFFNLFNTAQFSQPDGNMKREYLPGESARSEPLRSCMPSTIVAPGNFGTVTSIRVDSQREIQAGFELASRSNLDEGEHRTALPLSPSP